MNLTDSQLALIAIAQNGAHSMAISLPHIKASALREDPEMTALFLDDIDRAIRTALVLKRRMREHLRSVERRIEDYEEHHGTLAQQLAAPGRTY
ncbi:MAG: hypothetical protein PHQ12_03505 [Chthoniobacteraceae bacterium]|nr:hypothetical protein [Chthoniobacteraceae bacterium]